MGYNTNFSGQIFFDKNTFTEEMQDYISKFIGVDLIETGLMETRFANTKPIPAELKSETSIILEEDRLRYLSLDLCFPGRKYFSGFFGHNSVVIEKARFNKELATHLEYNGDENVHSMDVGLLFLYRKVLSKFPNFSMYGFMLCQGEDMKDRWGIEVLPNPRLKTKRLEIEKFNLELFETSDNVDNKNSKIGEAENSALIKVFNFISHAGGEHVVCPNCKYEITLDTRRILKFKNK